MLTVHKSCHYYKCTCITENMQTPLHSDIFEKKKTCEILSMKYLWSSTINTQNISFKCYCLAGLLASVDLSSISIYNEANYIMNFTIFQPLIYIA